LSELLPGLYEALLTEWLASQLPSDAQLYRTGPLDPAEAPAVLAAHVASILEIALRAPSMGNLSHQVELANRVIESLDRHHRTELSGDLLKRPVAQLLEILRRPKSSLGRAEPIVRPGIPLSQDALLVGAKQEPALAAELRRELPSADGVDLLCAFVRWTGIRVLLGELRQLRDRGAPLRVITTTYTGSTEARALDELTALGAQVRVSYDTSSTRLHAKAWLFERQSGFSTAYIGSSNLSHSALHDGLEWNVRLAEATSPALLGRFRAAFETYWNDGNFEPYDRTQFREAQARSGSPREAALIPFEIQPYPFQREMLYLLEVERERHDRWRNLIVAATGTGKTVVSAFDYKRLAEKWGGASLLFVAHRREILEQSRSVFRNVLRDGNFGELMVAGDRPREGRHVFASIQSLAALGAARLSALAPDAFDVVIVDEFHHAEAPTYRRLLERLHPRLLVGMTATPERADGLDIKAWFGGHIAVELRLWDALEQGLLCPFQYFGVADDVDLSSLTWRRGGYDPAQLDQVYTGNDARAAMVLRALEDIVEDARSMRALGFCVSVRHAQYMAVRFSSAGIPGVAISAASTAEDRSKALHALRRGEINIIFAVDVFNEGLDIPEIDTVLFLRPTESPVLFLQQFGRGLRRTEGKPGLTVLDFIGQQHRRFRFDERFRALIGGDRRNVQRQIEDGFPFLPAGCSISLDRQSQHAILQNIRSAANQLRSQLSDRLREIGDVSLNEFIRESGFSVEDVYSGGNPGWSAIRRQAGFLGAADPDEALLSRALSRMLHVCDPERVEAYCYWLRSAAPPDLPGLDERRLRLLHMLHFDLWSAQTESVSLRASLERLWANPAIVNELRELLEELNREARYLAPAAGLEPEIPLRLHTRYSRNELLAALGEASAERQVSWREGIRWVERYKLDALLVTLDKSERQFSPTTRYRDYPVSPSRFHWESQSTTRESSPTGQRYIRHQELGSRILLFVRESSVGESLGAAPFLFLGAASYENHQGERPMAIVWRLDHEMPPDFFKAARVAA
jgi:superfamily II DNA or RNA helicase